MNIMFLHGIKHFKKDMTRIMESKIDMQRVDIHTQTHTCMYACTHAHMRTCTYACTHDAHTMHAHTHERMHARTHTHTYTHTHTS